MPEQSQPPTWHHPLWPTIRTALTLAMLLIVGAAVWAMVRATPTDMAGLTPEPAAEAVYDLGAEVRRVQARLANQEDELNRLRQIVIDMGDRIPQKQLDLSPVTRTPPVPAPDPVTEILRQKEQLDSLADAFRPKDSPSPTPSLSPACPQDCARTDKLERNQAEVLRWLKEKYIPFVNRLNTRVAALEGKAAPEFVPRYQSPHRR